MSRWLLVNPPVELVADFEVKRLADPLSLLYVAAELLRQGHEVEIFDFVAQGFNRSATIESGRPVRPADAACAKLITGEKVPRITERKEIHVGFDASTEAEFHALCKRFSPHVIGISSMFSDQWAGAEWAACHAPRDHGNPRIVFGGVHATMFLHPLLSDPIIRPMIGTDWEAVPGEFDQPEANDDGSIVPPIPARNLLDWDPYWAAGRMYREPNRGVKPATVMFSRGCVANCTFCCSRKMMGYFRPYSLDRIEAELDALATAGFDELFVVDDCLTGRGTAPEVKRMETICGLMADRGFKWYAANSLPIYSLSPGVLELFVKSGCYKITVSIETGSPDTMKRIRKPVRLDRAGALVAAAKSLGVRVESMFVIGFPWETREDVKSTIDFSQSLGLDYVSYPLATPFPGTDFYAECLANRWLLPGLKLRDLKFGINNIVSPHWDGEWIENVRKTAWEAYNR